jgi:hypothetical protein
LRAGYARVFGSQIPRVSRIARDVTADLRAAATCGECSRSRQLSRYFHDTCEKCCFAPLLDMEDVSQFYVLDGRFACLILQNDWWLSQIAISPKPGFSLRFRRCVLVNNRMVLGVCSSQLPAWVFPRRMKLHFVDHRLLCAGLE